MFSLRTHALISGGLFALIIAMAIVGNAIQASGIVKHPEALQTPMKIIFFTLFIVFAFSLIPTMVKAFIAGQGAIGNADKGPIKLIERHQLAVIYGIWGIWILGFAMALPTMIRSGFFTDLGGGSTSSTGTNDSDAEIAKQIASTPVQGTLVAVPGMTIRVWFQATKPGVYELPLGYPMLKAIYEVAGGIPGGKKLKAVVPGGSSCPLLKADECDIPMDYDSLAKIGSMLGSGGMW